MVPISTKLLNVLGIGHSEQEIFMSDAGATRGSHKLLAQLAKKGHTATPEDVKAAIALPVAADYKLLRWLIRGTPAYFEVETMFQMNPSQLGEAVNHFAENSAVRDINILINGIPKPDIAQINVTLAHGEI